MAKNPGYSGLEPKFGTRIRQDEVIFLNYFANAAPTRLRASARVIYDDGSEQTFSIDADSFTTNRSAVTLFPGGVNNSVEGNADRARQNGWVVTVNVQRFGAARLQRGQFYVIMGVGGGTIESSILTQGYFWEGHDLRLGTYIEAGPAGGPGNRKDVTNAQPAAGADYATLTVPAGAIWRPIGFNAQLVTSAAAANREFVIEYANSGGGISGGCVAGEIQTATLTDTYFGITGAAAAGVSAALGTGAVQIGLGNYLLMPSEQVIFKTFNIQGADQWGPVGGAVLSVEEWVVPN